MRDQRRDKEIRYQSAWKQIFISRKTHF